MEPAAIVLSALSICLSAALAVAVSRLTKKNEQAQRTLYSLQRAVEATLQPIAAASKEPLELSGYRITLGIIQDHTIPTFSLLLKDALSALDAKVTLMDAIDAQRLVERWRNEGAGNECDLLITGEVICNGYSELYFKAHLEYHTHYGNLNPTSEQPAQGRPQNSLVLDTISKLKTELGTARARSERGQALDELRQEGLLSRRDR